MAGAGQPFYMPLTWPVGHVATAIFRKDPKEPAPKPAIPPEMDFAGHLTSAFGATRSFLMALVCIYGLYDNNDDSNLYPAFGPAVQLEWHWMQPIFLRNLLAAWIICGTWDWYLYASPLASKLHKYKLNPTYPYKQQFIHDALLTSVATTMAGILEIALCHAWASGRLKLQRNLLDTPAQNFLWAVTITHWRVPHFYVMHRAMHPWFPLKRQQGAMIPDVGRFLYRHVHSLHHKSYNPTAFSGTSMHPVESFLYFTAALVCVPFGCHPAIFLGCIIDCAVGAWLGHDGFQWPAGSGDYFHQLHHEHFECNYGSLLCPMDKWMGTHYCGSNKDKVVATEMERMNALQEKHVLHPSGGSSKFD